MFVKLTQTLALLTLLSAANIYADSTADAEQINQPALWPKPANPVAAGSENSKALKVVQNFFNAYGKGDLEALKQYVAEDVEWHIPGVHKLAGTKRALVSLQIFSVSWGKQASKLK